MGRLFSIVLPGILVAATGVGAGDLATAAFTGNKLGTAVLWAVAVGAFFKFSLNEGLARFQLATQTTLLEHATQKLGRIFHLIFLLYLITWSFFVAAAIISACGVAGYALVQKTGLLQGLSAEQGKIYFGVAHSLAGCAFVWLGNFKTFERLMATLIGLMFICVLVSAILMIDSWQSVMTGFTLSIPKFSSGGLVYTVALMGGVGGTLTVLSYSYWMREAGRFREDALKTCRVDLAVSYTLTAFFGLAMVIIGSQVTIEGKGARLLVALTERISEQLGPALGLVFLIGAWGALFSSLLGVWQSVPYIFTDFWQTKRNSKPQSKEVNSMQRGYLLALTFIPLLGLFFSFKEMQKLYAVLGAMFMPFLAVLLLIFNRRHQLKNRALTNVFLVLLIFAFLCFGYFSLRSKLF